MSRALSGAFGGIARYAMKDGGKTGRLDFRAKNLAIGVLNNGLYEIEDSLGLYDKHGYIVPATIEAIEMVVLNGFSAGNIFTGMGIGTALFTSVDYLYIPALPYANAVATHLEPVLGRHAEVATTCVAQGLFIVLPVVFAATSITKDINTSVLIAGVNALGQVATCVIRKEMNQSIGEYLLSNVDYYAAQITLMETNQEQDEMAVVPSFDNESIVSDINNADEYHDDM